MRSLLSKLSGIMIEANRGILWLPVCPRMSVGVLVSRPMEEKVESALEVTPSLKHSEPAFPEGVLWQSCMSDFALLRFPTKEELWLVL